MRHLPLLLLLVATPVASAQPLKPQTFRARLSTVPIDVAMQSTIAGSGTVSATLVDNTLTVKGTFNGLPSAATVAKIHVGPKGIRGPAVIDLEVTKATSGTLSGTLKLTPERVDDLTHSRFYVQLHSEKSADGTLWGWLLPQETRR